MMTENMLDPKDVASNVYNPLMENERVRIFKAVFKPGDTAKMHHHPDHVVYVLKGGNLKLTSEDKTDNLTLEDGKALFLNEQVHEAQNVGQSTVELLVVELKK
jgi:quercetin dioxygenase-like cupin family protein